MKYRYNILPELSKYNKPLFLKSKVPWQYSVRSEATSHCYIGSKYSSMIKHDGGRRIPLQVLLKIPLVGYFFFAEYFTARLF